MFVIDMATALVNHKPDLKVMMAALKDQSIPLDERWEAFEILVNGSVLTSTELYGDGFIDTLRVEGKRELTLYDDFYIERHETTSYTRFLERILDVFQGDGLDMLSLAKWKEKVLASGYASFTFDW